MLSTEAIFIYLFILTPVFSGFMFIAFRAIYYWYTPAVFIVEPTHIVQRIHTTEPLEIAHPIQTTGDSEYIQVAEPFHAPEPFHVPEPILTSL